VPRLEEPPLQVIAALQAGREAGFDEGRAADFFAALGVPMAKSVAVPDARRVAAAVGEVGAPVVLKILSADIPHKTEAGGVALGIPDGLHYGGDSRCQRGHSACGGPCIGFVGPAPDLCNGLDDDCNGTIDDGLTQPCSTACGTGTEECRAGKWVFCTAPKPEAEVCDGKDNDCNGQIDDSFPEKGRSCTDSTKKGECQKGTYTICKDAKLVCTSNVNPAPIEICDNGKDDNCDGQIDEVFPKKGLACTVAGKEGACAEGIFTACQNGVAVCTQLQEPEPQERCDDGIDNDCNGKVDADDTACPCKPGAKGTCYTGAAGTAGKGLCKDGERTCLLSGRWGPCEGQIIPKAEECNNQDDDCDGQVDEDFVGKGGSST